MIPADPTAVTAEWLSHVLGVAVTSVAREPIGGVEGFTGQVVRLRIDAPPGSLIAKFPAADPKRRAMYHRLGFAMREHRFYREVARRGAIDVPRVYHGELDPASGDGVLLLEDLAGWTCLGDRASECSRADAELVVGALARFHAAWWDQAPAWIPSFGLGAGKTQEAWDAVWWPAFERSVPSLEALPHARELGRRMGTHIAAVKQRLAQPPVTVVHLDCRPDNLFVSPGGLKVIDWESMVLGRGPLDLAYFALASLSVEERRAGEQELLGRYHAALVEHGVRDYPFDRCLDDYRLSFLQPVLAVVYSVTVLNTLTTARGRKVIEDALIRIDAAAADHGLPDRW